MTPADLEAALLAWPSLSASHQEQTRLSIRSSVLADLYLFAKGVLGMKDLDPTLHRDVCAFLMGPSRYKCLQLPRQHLKTSVGTIAYGLWRIAKDPGIRILLRTATATNVTNWIREMERHLLTNPILKWLFPDLTPTDLTKCKWTEMAFDVPHVSRGPEATVTGFGVGGTAVSQHFDLIIEDDLVNEDHLIAHEQMKKTVEEHLRAVSLFVDPSKGEELLIGNRWAFDDVISHAMTEEPWFVHYKRAAIEHGEPIWPVRFSRETLDEILERQGPKIFSCQYLNNPVHEDSRSFDPAWIRHFRDVPLVPMRYYTAVDPSMSQKKWADYTSIVTVGADPEYRLWVVDARRGRWGVDEFIDELFAVARLYRPVRIGIESMGFSRALQYPIRDAMRREQLSLPIEPVKAHNLSKMIRISSLHEYFQSGALWIRNGLDELEQELKEFPVGRHDDLADALAYAVFLARPASKLAKMTTLPFNSLEGILQDLKTRSVAHNSIWTFHKPDRQRWAVGAEFRT